MTVIKKKTSMKNRIREFKSEQDAAARISYGLAQCMAGLGSFFEADEGGQKKSLEHPAGRVISAILASLETTYHVKDLFQKMNEENELRENMLLELSLAQVKPEAVVSTASCELIYSVLASPDSDCNSKEFREMAMAVLNRSMQDLVYAYQIEEDEHDQAIKALREAFAGQKEKTEEAVPETAVGNENAVGTDESVDSSNQ